jgi:hypothetical protein
MQSNPRQERRQLKQKLFLIRRFIEGEDVTLTPEHETLKAAYEKQPNFTNWSDFPERWDVGDPHRVKKGSYGNEVDQMNFSRAFGKPLTEIISKVVVEEK